MSPPKQQPENRPEELLAAFKAAALSVTKLYKTAAGDQTRVRAEGYQEALDDLLLFLEKENLGFSDGEGWKVRKWATERLDGRDVPQNPESDDEPAEQADRSSSPVLQRTQLQTATPVPNRAPSPEPEVAAPSIDIPDERPIIEAVPPQSQFSFRSAYTYPQDSDMMLSDPEISDNNYGQSHDGTAAHVPSSITITGRQSRNNSRHPHLSRSTRSSSTIGKGAGQKRKHINLGEFFDIGSLGHSKDGFGGGGAKRGRHI